MKNKPKTQAMPVGNISVGDISNTLGLAIGHGASATISQGMSDDEVKKLFKSLIQKVNELPDGPSKIIAQQAITGLEQEVNKGDAAQEQKIYEWLNFLAQTAPDAWDVAVTTLANPVAGVAKIVQLIAQKAKEEKEKKK